METAPPTPSQLLSLIALVPATNPHPPNVRLLLQDLLGIINTSEILNYLFASEPEVHLPLLLDPSLPANAMTFHQSTTRVEPPPSLFPSPTYRAMSSHHIASSFVLAPALTFAPLTTLGVGVMESVHLLGPQILPLAMDTSTSRCLNFRFLCDPARQLNLFVYDSPEDDSVVIYLCSVASLTALHSFTASFKRNQLLASIRAKGDSLAVDDMQSALRFLFRDMNVRICPVCHAPPTAPCTCQIPPAMPTHPHDFSYFKRNFLTYFGGAYEGVATLVCDKLPAFLKRNPVLMGTRLTMKSVPGSSLAERLRSWAVSKHFRNVPYNPLESVSFARDPALLAVDDSPHERNGDGGAYANVHGERHGGGNNAVSDHLAELLAEVSADDGDHTPISMVSSQLQDDETWMPFLAQPPSTFQLGPLADGEGVGELTKAGLGADMSTINTESDYRTERKGRVKRSRHEISTTRSPRSDSTGIFYSTQPAGSPLSDSAGIFATLQSVPLEDTGELENIEFALYGPATTAVATGGAEGHFGGSGSVPGTVPSTVPGNDVKVGEGEDVHEVLKQMKDEERKKRNRISARQSNRKKKEKGLALEAELKRLRGTADELRAKEVRLREENGVLRGAFQEPQ